MFGETLVYTSDRFLVNHLGFKHQEKLVLALLDKVYPNEDTQNTTKTGHSKIFLAHQYC